MKTLLVRIAAVIGILIGTPALAADMPVKAARAPIVSTEFSWTGFYGGVSAGAARSSYDWRYTNPAPATCCAPFSASTDDVIIGFFGGAQYQFSHIVVGVEGSFSDFVGNKFATGSAPACVFPNSSTTTCQIRTQAISTFGGRLGLAWADWMIYGEGGWAHATVQSQLNAPGIGPADATSAGYNGTFFGGGIEHVLIVVGPTAALIGGLEYQHIDLGTQLHLSSLDLFRSCPPGVNCRTIGAKEDIFRVRVSLKFNPVVTAAVAARY
jgi:outer membrane immunogenic protein